MRGCRGGRRNDGHHNVAIITINGERNGEGRGMTTSVSGPAEASVLSRRGLWLVAADLTRNSACAVQGPTECGRASGATVSLGAWGGSVAAGARVGARQGEGRWVVAQGRGWGFLAGSRAQHGRAGVLGLVSRVLGFESWRLEQ
jgi:hypothetical protein